MHLHCCLCIIPVLYQVSAITCTHFKVYELSRTIVWLPNGKKKNRADAIDRGWVQALVLQHCRTKAWLIKLWCIRICHRPWVPNLFEAMSLCPIDDSEMSQCALHIVHIQAYNNYMPMGYTYWILIHCQPDTLSLVAAWTVCSHENWNLAQQRKILFSRLVEVVWLSAILP